MIKFDNNKQGFKMKKLLTIWLTLLITLSSANSQTSTDISLELDTLGHTAKIKKNIIITKAGDIITCSNDKTIRVWDSKTGKEKRKILGQIGKGSGEIYAIALSPDEKWLAVGGMLAGENNRDIACAIRIYNYPTGKLIKVLKSHTNVVNDLSYSPDGKYLISGSADNTAKIWDAKTWDTEPLDTLTHHTNAVYAVKIVKHKKRYIAITAGDDNQIALYDIKKKKIKSDKSDYKLRYLATTNRHIAVCGFGREIRIYDYELNLTKKITSETVPSGLSYSPNQKLLIAGTGANPTNVNIYNQNYELINSFQEHKNLTQAVTFLSNTVAVSAGGDNNEIYLWGSKTGEVKRKIEGVGEIVWSVGVKGDMIGWGNEDDCPQKNCSSIQKTLNLKTMTVGLTVPNNIKRIATTKNNLSLTHTKGGDYGYSNATLILKRDQKEITSITRDSTDGLVHRCYGFYKNYIISGGSNGILKIYNFKGKEIANLVGHRGEVWSIALDGDRLVSGSDDQTIRVWDLSKVKNNEEFRMLITNIKLNSIASQYGLKVGDIIYSIDNKKFNLSDKFFKYIKPMKSYLFNIIRDNKKINLKIDKTEKIFGFTDKDISIKEIEPQLNIFITKTKEHIAWTNEGYFTASESATQYLYFHINQGVEKEATAIPMKRLYDHFFRPDLIKFKLNGDEEAYQKAINGMTYKEALSNPPPKVNLLTADEHSIIKSEFKYNDITTTKPKTKLTFDVKEYQKGGIGLIRIYQEGKLIQTIGEGDINRTVADVYNATVENRLDKQLKVKQVKQVKDKEIRLASKSANIPTNDQTSPKDIYNITNKQEGNQTIEAILQSGDNQFCVEAFNKTNTVTSYRECVTIHANIPKRKPKLYGLAIGVNKFKKHGARLNNLKYSENDAKDIKNTIEKQNHTLYESIEIETLLSEDVSEENILAKLKAIKQKASIDDTIIFYISTHGTVSNNELYLLPQNGANEFISFKKLFKAMQSILSLKQILIVDACQSGQASNIVSSIYDSRASVLAKSAGVHLLLATTKTTEAFESKKVKNGVFTHQILTALKDKETDTNKDNTVSIIELSARLKAQAHTIEKQYPIIRNVGGDVKLREL